MEKGLEVWYLESKEPVWSGSLTTAPKYKLDLRGVQEVISQKEDTVKARNYNFFSVEKETEIIY